MEAVENMKGVGALLADDLQIGLPHIGADEDDLRSQFVADDSEESPKGFDNPLTAYSEQTGNVEIGGRRHVPELASSIRTLYGTQCGTICNKFRLAASI